MDQLLTVEQVTVTFPARGSSGAVEAVRDCSFSLGRGEIIALIGPSGCGKSTIFNVIAGLITPTCGEISFADLGHQPKAGCVFQSSRLLPWATIRENIEFALVGMYPQMSAADRTAHAMEALARVHLHAFADHLPRQLSGGMQQRASVARALVIDPDLLLMDEPFGALDALTRRDMQIKLARDVEEIHKSVVLITHDIDEALLLADRVLVLTHRPGQVKSEVNVPFPRPRASADVESTLQFAELRTQLLSDLQEEFDRQSRTARPADVPDREPA